MDRKWIGEQFRGSLEYKAGVKKGSSLDQNHHELCCSHCKSSERGEGREAGEKEGEEEEKEEREVRRGRRRWRRRRERRRGERVLRAGSLSTSSPW